MRAARSPSPATDDGIPDGDDGGVVAVIDALDAECAAGLGPGAAAAEAEAAAPSDGGSGVGIVAFCRDGPCAEQNPECLTDFSHRQLPVPVDEALLGVPAARTPVRLAVPQVALDVGPRERKEAVLGLG